MRREQLATLILTENARIQSEWLAVIRARIPTARLQDDLTLLDSLGEYLNETADALSDVEENEVFRRSITTAREHGRSRARIGYSAGQVASEYAYLREVVLEIAGFFGTIRLDVLRTFNRIIDAGSIVAVEELLQNTVVARERVARREAEDSEAAFRKFMDISPAMVWLTDLDSKCTYLSKSWSEFTGRPVEADLGTGWLENIHPDDLEATAEMYARAVANKGPLRMDYRLRKHTGEYRWAVDMGNPRFDEHGCFAGYIGTVTDIHERVMAERHLEEEQIRFERSTAATDLGVWYCDLPFDELIWNNEVKSHFFLPPDYPVTIDTFYERLHPDDREPTRRAIDASIENRAPYQTTFRTTNPHDPNEIKHIRAVGWTDYDGTGSPTRFDGITLDVSQQVFNDRELREAKTAAEAANTAKSAFLANMSHEIRTPLGAIMGYSELAREPGTSREDIARHLAVVERNSAQVLRIIDDILDLAKVESGRVELESIDFSLTEFLADIGSLFGFRARENGIIFRIDAETDLPDHVCADPTRLRQVLTNSVGNAIKFTTKGSVTLHVCFEDGLLKFGVTDTGRGVSPDQAANLFQAFMQADASTTRKFGGTGLGLVLTKRLCQLMGGDYVLSRSELNVGSKFEASIRVTLPGRTRLLNKTEISFAPRSPEKFRSPQSRLDGISILLVEDSPDNRMLIRLILERQGARLECAGDGVEGVAKALAGAYDLVLMDIQMPLMDGHEAMRALRAKNYSTPVVALTAHAMKDEMDRARDSGFTNFLSKPINRDQLVAMINSLVGTAPG